MRIADNACVLLETARQDVTITTKLVEAGVAQPDASSISKFDDAVNAIAEVSSKIGEMLLVIT